MHGTEHTRTQHNIRREWMLKQENGCEMQSQSKKIIRTNRTVWQ